MPIQSQACDRKLQMPESYPSSSSSACNIAYAYIISSPSDAADGRNPENMKKTIRAIMADFESYWDDHIPVAQPWPESKSTFTTNEPSTSPAAAAEEEEEEEEDDNIDAQLKAVFESLRDLYRESEVLFKKVFAKFLQDHLLTKKKKEDQTDPKRKAFLELGNKRISRILKQTKHKQMKAGMLQRSLSVDSPRTPLGRFKIKTLDLGGAGGGGPHDIKGTAKDR